VDYTKSLCCNQDVAVGLSWREETELRKALYASMQKQKQHREKDESLPVDSGTTYALSLEYNILNINIPDTSVRSAIEMTCENVLCKFIIDVDIDFKLSRPFIYSFFYFS